MSPVIPRPVGPTTDWNGSLTTTASLPRNRTHVRPYQVSSIAFDTVGLTPRHSRPRGRTIPGRAGGASSAGRSSRAARHPSRLPARMRRPDHPRTAGPRRLADAPGGPRCRRPIGLDRRVVLPRSRPTCRRRRSAGSCRPSTSSDLHIATSCRRRTRRRATVLVRALGDGALDGHRDLGSLARPSPPCRACRDRRLSGV